MTENELIYAPDVDCNQEKLVHDVFERLVQKHEGGSADLKLLPYDPKVYPFQRLDVIGVRGKRVDIDTIRSLARSAYKHFDDVEAQFAGRPDLLNHMADVLLAGHDILNLYDHSTMINGAVVGAAARCALIGFAANELHVNLTQVREDMILSKLTTRLAAFGSIPIPEVTCNIWDTYFSIPPSRTIRGSAISEATRQSVNQAMLDAYTAPQEEPSSNLTGAIHTLHGSGSTDVEQKSGLIGHRHRTVHMGPLSSGTARLMDRSMILPIGATLGEREPIITIGHLRPPIKSPEEAHGIMGSIARMNAEATGNEYIYHPTNASFATAIR